MINLSICILSIFISSSTLLLSLNDVIAKDIHQINNISIINDSAKSYYDAFFLDEILSNYPLCYDLPEQHDKNVVSLLWNSSRSNTVYFDGVPLNSIIYGDFDFLRLPYNNSQVISVNHMFPSTYYSGVGNSGYIALQSSREPSSLHKINVQGGNAHGSSQITVRGGKPSLFWDVTGNFYTSNGHTISSAKPDTISVLRQNSKARHYSLFAKAGIKDVNSMLMFSVFFSDISREIPMNIFFDSLRAQEIGGGLSLVNIEFSTVLNSFFSISGNIYFKGADREIIGFTKTTSVNETQFSSEEDEQTFGGNVRSEMRIFEGVNSNIILGYRKDIASMTEIRGTFEEYARNSSENLNLKIELESSFSRLFDVSGAIEYSIYNVLSNTANESLHNLSYINSYFQIATKISKDINWINYAKFGSQLPSLVLMSEQFSSVQMLQDIKPEKISIFSSALNWEISSFGDLSVGYNLLDSRDVSRFDFVNDRVVILRDGKYLIHAVSFHLNAFYQQFEFILRGDYKINNNDTSNFMIRPKSQIYIQLGHYFSFGFVCTFETKYQGATQDYDSIKQQVVKLDEFLVFNVRFSQRVFNENEIFVRINNITDDFRLKSWGNPIKGRNFIAGINLYF